MRKIFIAITTLLINCSTSKNATELFTDLADKESVTIILSDFKLDGVPHEISRLTKAKRLYITADTGSWTIYPPLSALPQPTEMEMKPNLPNEITELSNLKVLGLVRLNLKSLPDNFANLKNLDTLDLSMNQLEITNEMQKLRD